MNSQKWKPGIRHRINVALNHMSFRFIQQQVLSSEGHNFRYIIISSQTSNLISLQATTGQNIFASDFAIIFIDNSYFIVVIVRCRFELGHFKIEMNVPTRFFEVFAIRLCNLKQLLLKSTHPSLLIILSKIDRK